MTDLVEHQSISSWILPDISPGDWNYFNEPCPSPP